MTGNIQIKGFHSVELSTKKHMQTIRGLSSFSESLMSSINLIPFPSILGMKIRKLPVCDILSLNQYWKVRRGNRNLTPDTGRHLFNICWLHSRSFVNAQPEMNILSKITLWTASAQYIALTLLISNWGQSTLDTHTTWLITSLGSFLQLTRFVGQNVLVWNKRGIIIELNTFSWEISIRIKPYSLQSNTSNKSVSNQWHVKHQCIVPEAYPFCRTDCKNNVLLCFNNTRLKWSTMQRKVLY